MENIFPCVFEQDEFTHVLMGEFQLPGILEFVFMCLIAAFTFVIFQGRFSFSHHPLLFDTDTITGSL